MNQKASEGQTRHRLLWGPLWGRP